MTKQQKMMVYVFIQFTVVHHLYHLYVILILLPIPMMVLVSMQMKVTTVKEMKYVIMQQLITLD